MVVRVGAAATNLLTWFGRNGPRTLAAPPWRRRLGLAARARRSGACCRGSIGTSAPARSSPCACSLLSWYRPRPRGMVRIRALSALSDSTGFSCAPRQSDNRILSCDGETDSHSLPVLAPPRKSSTPAGASCITCASSASQRCNDATAVST